MWQLGSIGVAIVLSVFAARSADAQELTGALIGTIKDEQGAVLANARVRLASPSMLGESATQRTGDDGRLRFPVLLPGSYSVDVELQGFAPYHESDIRIDAGATISISVVLRLAALVGSVVVEGSSTRIEARSSGIEARFGPEYFNEIPSRRYSMFDALRAAPGISPTSPSSGTVNTLSAFGSGGNENIFLIDGTNFTCPCSGVSRAEPSVGVIEEVQVQSVGVSPEYGNAQGAVFNVVTRQGGNRLQGDAAYYLQADSLTSQPVLLPIPGTKTQTGYHRDRYRDFTANVGGPVLRDRIWFFSGYQYLRDYDSQPGTDPLLPRQYEQNKIFGKLTWRPTPKFQMMQSFNDEHWVSPQTPTRVTPVAATQRMHATVPATTFAQISYTPSSNTVWDMRAGRFAYSRQDDPASGDWTTPNRFDSVTGVSSGNAPQLGSLQLRRTTAKATVSHFQRGWLRADHDWKLGTSFELGQHEQPQVIPGGTRYVDKNGLPSQAVSSAPSNTGGEFRTAAAFVSDALAAGDRIVVNAGLRFDYSRAVSQDLHAIDGNGAATDVVVPGLGTLYTWNVLSPRLGLVARLSGDGRTMLRASYGRFTQGVLTGEISPVHPGGAPVTTTAYDTATGGYTTPVSVVDSRINVRVDPGMKPPHTDEWSADIERGILSGITASLGYVRKRGSDFIGWTDVGGQYSEQTRALPDGSTIPVFVLTSPTASRRFLLTNPQGYSLRYDGLLLAIDKRRSHGWQGRASYTFSRTSGLQVSSGAAAADPQVSTVAPSGTFGRDPNSLTNADGRMPNDRPHMFRAMGAFDVPGTGMAISANFQYFSGKPWAATALVSPLPQGDQRVLLEERGSRRLSSQSLLDLRVSRGFEVAAGARIDLALDLLNTLNNTAEEALASDNLFSPTFGLPTVFVDPRRAMISVKVSFGG